MLNPFEHISDWTERIKSRSRKVNVLRNHDAVIREYFSNLSTTCDLPDLPTAELIINGDRWDPLSGEQLKKMFIVPKLNKFHQTQIQIYKCQPLEAFMSFLVQLLYHKTDSVDNRIEILEKELRFLLTVVGDMLKVDSNLMADLEAVANQVGCLVHSLLFCDDVASQVINEGLDAALNHIHLLKATLRTSDITTPTPTPTSSIVNTSLTVGSLIHDLEDLLKREDNGFSDVKDLISVLHMELTRLQSSINDRGSPQPSEIAELKEPLMRVGHVTYQAKYLITALLVEFAPLWYVINRLTYLTHQIELIRTDLQVITEKYRFGGLEVKRSCSAQDRRSTETNDVTVGFEDEAIKILDQLVGGGTSMQVISIFGMPGLGKTTLAKKLYNHPLVRDRFDKLSWCVISQSYERQSILAAILTRINSEHVKDGILIMEEELIAEHIFKTLRGRRYFIVIDDIWDSNVWYDFKRCFPEDCNGSRILLTSRNKNVAPPDCLIHELPFLSDEQCWELLKMKVFGSRTCPSELQPIGKKTAARCCGLPLTVVVIAGVLSTVDEEESAWEEVGGRLGSYIDGEENSVMQILELSYKHLPQHLKPCFLYFGAFKEDQKIIVGNLKRLWVAEGFIRKEAEKSREDIAEEYLTELIDKSLVIVAERRSDGRGAKACMVHDLLLELCLKKREEESFQKYSNSNFDTVLKKGHQVQMIGNSTNFELTTRRSNFDYDYTSSLYVGDMTLLRVLHFSYIRGGGRLFGIEYLVNLRFLVIEEVPPSIEKLLNLEYLCVSGCRTYIPETIVKMNKLRYLYAIPAKFSEDWNSCLTSSLEYLSELRIEKLKDAESLKCFPRLRKLKCIYDHLMGYTDSPQIDLRFLTQLDSLRLQSLYELGNFRLPTNVRFPANVRKLTLHGSMMSWEKMTILGRLENLEVLKLTRIYNSYDSREEWDTRDGEFQKLRRLKIEGSNLSQWNVASNQHFPRLEELILRDCYFLQEIPGEIGEITTLELIEVTGICRSLRESVARIKQEQLDMGNDTLKIIHHEK